MFKFSFRKPQTPPPEPTEEINQELEDIAAMKIINNFVNLKLDPDSAFYKPFVPRFPPQLEETQCPPCNCRKCLERRLERRPKKYPRLKETTYGLACNLLSRLEDDIVEFQKELEFARFPTDNVEFELDPFYEIDEEKRHWDKCTQLILPKNQERPELYVPYLIIFHKKINEKIQKERFRLKDNLPLHLLTDPFEKTKDSTVYNFKPENIHHLIFLMNIYGWKDYIKDRKMEETFYFHLKRAPIGEQIQIDRKENNSLYPIPNLETRDNFDIGEIFATELNHRPESQRQTAIIKLLFETANEEPVKMPAVDEKTFALQELHLNNARLYYHDPGKKVLGAEKLEAAKKFRNAKQFKAIPELRGDLAGNSLLKPDDTKPSESYDTDTEFYYKLFGRGAVIKKTNGSEKISHEASEKVEKSINKDTIEHDGKAATAVKDVDLIELPSSKRELFRYHARLRKERIKARMRRFHEKVFPEKYD